MNMPCACPWRIKCPTPLGKDGGQHLSNMIDRTVNKEHTRTTSDLLQLAKRPIPRGVVHRKGPTAASPYDIGLIMLSVLFRNDCTTTCQTLQISFLRPLCVSILGPWLASTLRYDGVQARHLKGKVP
jgi:hypothetical protein